MGVSSNTNSLRIILLALGVLALAACSSQRELMPAPNLYNQPDAPALFDGLDPSLQTSTMDILYVTDRSKEQDEEGNLTYGWGRSHSAAFGSIKLAIKPEVPWDRLVELSLQPERDETLTIELDSITELGRFPATPLPATIQDGQVTIKEEALLAVREAEDAFHAELRRRLAVSNRKEVLLFVHGFNNDMEYAAETLANLWHFLGREYVPILYTWPAGRGGATGYTYDRESGEFTIFHLKNILSSITAVEEVEQLQLLAHSRGTDVLSTAVRELILTHRAGGVDPLDTLRIENYVLAAPDLDMDVVSQRMVAEYLGTGVGDVTIYTAEDDKAIGIAEWLFKSRRRMGRVSLESFDPENAALLQNVEGISFVRLEEVADSTGHGYFHNSPEASSDLILNLRYERQPGAEHGRPLESKGPRFWLIEPGYPAQTTGSN
ncbi:MAG: alpha/beta hydrolase [Pseudomonadota bacterium]